MAHFCHLHTHTEYSLLDGASRIRDLVKRAQALGQPALAITDHGNMFGAIEFYNTCSELNKAAKAEGKPTVKPIIGMEAYIVPDGQSRHGREKVEGQYDHHCLLWASNQEGYKNLMKLSSLAFSEGFYMHPRIDRDLLAKFGKGIIASSGCVGSEVPQTIIYKGYDKARDVAAIFMDILGKENFYFELQNQCRALHEAMQTEQSRELMQLQDKVNAGILKLAKEFGGKIIATNDSHYTSRDDAAAHDALLCIGTGKLLGDTNRLKFACDEFYLKSTEEMAALFGDLPEALANTIEIAERCNLEITFGTYHFPKFPIPKGMDELKYFEKLTWEGIEARYGKNPSAEVVARTKEELRVLAKMGFLGYLLIVWDIIAKARAVNIPVGPGRGSAAGSIVCYALGITDIDPLKYQLLFERFVNEGRNEMPDIDIDFCQARRPEIIEYVQNKYGRDCTAGIITFNTLAAKGSIRDLGRVMDWPLQEVDKIAKLIPNIPKVTLKSTIEEEPDFKELYKSDERTRKLIDMAQKIEGIVRNPGRHAAGLVVADKDITEYCPLYRDKDGALLTQYEMAHIDAVGLLKIDFLGLANLTILDLANIYIERRHGKKIDLNKVPLEDEKTFRMLARGEAKGVFQFESDGMIKMLMEARPDRIEDLIALNAMYRPGPLDNIPSFIARKHGKETIHYLTPQLESILNETYGIIVYQEQVMQIANKLANFTLSEADSLRKAMGKKKKDLMEKYGLQFEIGCEKNGISREIARELYALIEKFASYGFNKSHSAAYAYVAYQTAYLKANYTAEYMAALLSLNQGNSDNVVLYSEESKRIGLSILGPDLNKSEWHFTIENDKVLRFSLGAVKGVGERAVEAIVNERTAGGPFRDLFDFCERIDTKSVNRGCIESLIKAGAFDAISLNTGRARLIAGLEDALSRGASARRDKASGQGSLFGIEEDDAPPPALPDVPDWPDDQKLEEEKKVLGFYFSGHPLDDYRELVEGLGSANSRKLKEIPDGYEVVFGGYVNQVQSKVTRAKGEKMAVLVVEDFYGHVQVVCFPRIYERYKDLIQPDRALFFKGKLKNEEGTGDATIMPDEIMTLEEATGRYLSSISLIVRETTALARPAKIVNEPSKHHGTDYTAKSKQNAKSPPAAHAEKAFEARMDALANLFKAHRGQVPVWFRIDIENGQGSPAMVQIKSGQHLGIAPNIQFFSGLREILPHGSIVVEGRDNKARKAQEPVWRRQTSNVRAG